MKYANMLKYQSLITLELVSQNLINYAFGLRRKMKSNKTLLVDRYLNETEEEKEVQLISESSDESEAWDCETIISTYSNLENHPAKIEVPGKPKRHLPQKSVPFPGELGVGRDVITLGGKEMLPVNYLPQRKRIMEGLVREKLGSVEKPKRKVGEESKEEKKERKVTYSFCYML